MDYEKKYKQLHKLISDLYPYMSEFCKEKVEGFIPELKEFEDERIRKELIIHCRNIRCVTEEGAEKIAKWKRLELPGTAEIILAFFSVVASSPNLSTLKVGRKGTKKAVNEQLFSRKSVVQTVN